MPSKVKGLDIDAVFLDIVTRNADHRDVKSLDTDTLVEKLRKAKDDLKEVEKKLAGWNPGVRPGPSVQLIKDISKRLLGLIAEVSEHIACFKLLDDPGKAQKAADKRHYRFQRDKISHPLYEDHQIPQAVSKVVADLWYDSIVPAAEAGVRNAYRVSAIEDDPTFDDPYFVPPERGFEDEPLEFHKLCWEAFSAATGSDVISAAEQTIKQRMTGGRIAYARMKVEFSPFKWPEPLKSVAIAPFMQVQSTERFSLELKAWPIRTTATLIQVMSGTFTAVLLEPESQLKHTNIAQWVHQADTTALGKEYAFHLAPGSSLFVPFGWLLMLTATSSEFVHTQLGVDLDKKKEAMKKKPVAISTGAFLAYPLFDADRDQQAAPDLKTISSYTWAQAKTWIPDAWKVGAGDYFKRLGAVQPQPGAESAVPAVVSPDGADS